MSDDTDHTDEEVDGSGPHPGPVDDDGFVPPPIERLNQALLGSYVVEEEIGWGGMSTVYLAHDVKHDRNVALKVLKPEVAAMLGAERFISEIRTTANLQHPNILPLFDSGRADGSLFYVMPYVEGMTLQEWIDRDHELPVKDAVRIAREVADALDYAHRQGVVHRDIKPGNILLQDGRPLVTDFGIALAIGAAADTRLTETGISLGTPFYMSPEQAAGDRSVGPASDTYSLGAVLFEALVGEPPFIGPDARTVMSKVASTETSSVRTFREAVPENVDHAVQKALAKRPGDRFETSGDFGRALADPAFRYPGAHEPLGSDSPARSPSASPAPWSSPVLSRLLAALVVLLTVALGWTLSRQGAPAAIGPVHFTLLPGEGGEFVGAEAPGISEDGRLIAFPVRAGDTTRIQLRDLNGFASRPIEGTEGGFSPFFSPDGRWLGFFTLGELRKVPLSGGPPVTVAPLRFPMAATAVWLPGDTIVFAHANSPGLMAVSADGGVPWALTRPDEDGEGSYHTNPLRLPDGRVLFQIRRQADPRDWWVASVGTGVVAPATGEILRPELSGTAWGYLAGDRLLVWEGGEFRAVPFDLGRTAVDGPGAPVATALRGGDSCDRLQVSPSGTAVCADQRALRARTLAWFDRSGVPTPLPYPVSEYRWPRVNPDGSALAGLAGSALVVVERASGAFLDIAPLPAGKPVWTPDGEAVVHWRRDPMGSADLWVSARSMATPPRRLTDEPDRFERPTSVSPDGTTVLFHDESDLRAIPFQGGDVRRVTETDDAWERDGTFSPDGSLVAFSGNGTGSWNVYVTAWPEARARTRVTPDGGRNPTWAPDGTELYYLRGSSLMAVDVIRTPEISFSEPRELFRGDFWIDPSGDRSWDVGSDGRFLMIQGDDVVTLRVVTGLGGEGRDEG